MGGVEREREQTCGILNSLSVCFHIPETQHICSIAPEVWRSFEMRANLKDVFESQFKSLFLSLFLFCFVVFFVFGKVVLCSLDWPGAQICGPRWLQTHTDPSACLCASQVLRFYKPKFPVMEPNLVFFLPASTSCTRCPCLKSGLYPLRLWISTNITCKFFTNPVSWNFRIVSVSLLMGPSSWSPIGPWKPFNGSLCLLDKI